jgi:signal transduction histidine kinase
VAVATNDAERIERADPSRGLRVVAVAVALLLAAAIAATPFVGQGLSGLPGVSGSYVPVGDLAVDACIVAIALVVALARPGNVIGWLLLGFGGFGAVQNFAEAYGVRAQAMPGAHLPFGRLALSAGTSLWVPAFVVPAVLLLNVYPSGRTSGRWTRRINVVAVVASVLAVLAIGTSHSNATGDYRRAHDVVELPGWVGAALGVPSTLVLLGCVIVSVIAAIRRTTKARAPERQQLLLLLTSAALLIPLGFLGTVPRAAGLVLVPLAVAVGVLQFRLLGIDVIVRRTMLYAVLTGLVVAVYAATTAVVAAVTPSASTRTVIAAALVAVLLVPLRDRLQSAVDRVVYGARRDPLLAVRQVGTSMSAASTDPLPAVVQAVAGAVRASRVDVVAQDGGVLATTGGSASDRSVTYPLRAAGEHLADLHITPAAGEATLDPADDRVVEVLTVPLAAVVHATELNRRLAAASERALTATELERARIRRDLHDGLGPSLSGVALGLEAIKTALPGNPQLATTMTSRLLGEVQSAVEEIRRIIDALHPGALDRDGLVTALRERADAVTARSSGLLVTVEASETLPTMTPGVEHAAFRIADEAVNNVVRHASASRCWVRITADEDLLIAVTDNGVGMPTQPRREGVGLASMRKRALDLGGELTIRAGADGGTTIEARLPLVDAVMAS